MRLYDLILDDDELGPFFDDTEMPKLIDHQTKFIASLMGGPAAFSDAHLSGAHRDMTIHDSHFDRLKELVDEVLAEFNVAEEDTATVLAAIEAKRGLLVKAPAV